jgi:hypothetical protein
VAATWGTTGSPRFTTASAIGIDGRAERDVLGNGEAGDPADKVDDTDDH